MPAFAAAHKPGAILHLQAVVALQSLELLLQARQLLPALCREHLFIALLRLARLAEELEAQGHLVWDPVKRIDVSLPRAVAPHSGVRELVGNTTQLMRAAEVQASLSSCFLESGQQLFVVFSKCGKLKRQVLVEALVVDGAGARFAKRKDAPLPHAVHQLEHLEQDDFVRVVLMCVLGGHKCLTPLPARV